MTKLEFLKDTVNHFNSENRCESNGSCLYTPYSTETQGCAIGRFLTPEAQVAYDESSECAINYVFARDLLRSLAPEWMQKMPVKFLLAVQLLHDISSNWDSNGLTVKGWERVKEICTIYNLDFEKVKA